MQIMILGMHRSGTSTVARLLNMMGAYFGPEGSMTAPNAENPKGFWERRDVRAINDALIQMQGTEWNRVLAFDPGAVPQSVQIEQRKVAERLVLELDAHRPWVLKEPRFCVTLPFWMPLLETPIFVHVLRNPVQVALSLRTRNAIPASVGVALWEAYVLKQFRNAAGKPSVRVWHDAVLSDPVRETTRLFEELCALDVRRLDMPSEGEVLRFIDPTLFRSRDLRDEEERVLLPAQRLVWDACKEGCYDTLATMTLSRESHDVLAEYEPLALRLEEAEASRRQLDQQGRKLEELDSRVGQEGVRHRQAMAEIAAGLRDVARASQDLGATGAGFRELQARLAVQEELIGRANALLMKLPQDLRLDTASGIGRLVANLEAVERGLGERMEQLTERECFAGESLTRLAEVVEHGLSDESSLLDGFHRATEALAGRAASEIISRLAAIESGVRTSLQQVDGLEAWRDADNAWREKLESSILAKLASLRQAELGLMALAEKHDSVHRRLVKTLDDCAKASAAFRGSLTYRAARLLAWPLRLLRGGGDALDYVEASSRRELKRVAPESRMLNGLLDILRSTQTVGAPAAVRESVTSQLAPAAPFRRRNDPRNRQHLGDLKVLVLAWDVGHNPVGRAYMLAEALAQRFDVVLAGPQFPRYGSEVWPPIAGGSVPVITLPGGDYPEFFHRIQDLATKIEADVVIACKPRMPSLELGFLMKEALDRPLILDIDDHELSFFGDRPAIPAAELDAHLADKSLMQPFGEVWTRHAETLVGSCDALLVSNPALQRRFGGVLVPHARDFHRFDSALYSREEERARLGFAPSDRVVLFLGTVRPHKGVDRVVDAVLAIDDPRVKVCVIGDIPDMNYRAQLEASAGDRIRIHPSQPFVDLPRNVVIADLVVLLQDPDSAIARYQLPAKVVDALAMGVPVLATPTEPLAPLIAAGAVIATSGVPLQGDIAKMLASIDEHRERLAAMREQLRRDYSYEAIAQRMEDLIVGCLEDDPGAGLADEARALLARHRAMFPDTRTGTLPATAVGLDLIFFWKQNDTSLYGRRVDMLVEYFARREDVRSVTVFDAGTDVGNMRRWRSSDPLRQHGEVYKRTHAKRWGLMDRGKIRFATFVAAGKGRKNPLRRWPFLTSDTDLLFYLDFLRNVGVDPKRAVIFAYPCNPRLPAIIRGLEPRLVVCDLVDDHRTWAGLKPEALAAMEENYREVLSLSDIALSNCEAVKDGMAHWHSGIEVVSNACDVPDPGSVEEKPADLVQFVGPLLGYVGNLEDKLDLDLLGKLAEHRPDCHILLIGSAHANPGVLKLDRYPNVHLLGVRPYDQIGAYIGAFDVALIPHRDTEKTRSMNPLKLMVYCSHNVPVVTTEIANLGDLASFCRKAASTKEFLTAVDEALRDGRSKERSAELTAALERNCWATRVDRIKDMVDEALNGVPQPPTAHQA